MGTHPSVQDGEGPTTTTLSRPLGMERPVENMFLLCASERDVVYLSILKELWYVINVYACVENFEIKVRTSCSQLVLVEQILYDK